MIRLLLVFFLAFIFTLMEGMGQNSLLVNFGSNTCVQTNNPGFSLIKNPLGTNPTVLSQCSMTGRLPDFFAVFISYNPKDNRIYLADVRTFTQSRIWRLDIGLPQAINCPVSIPTTPTFTTNYVSNNFEFDQNGDIWSLSAYDPALRQCRLDKFDLVTGNVINTRILQFPAANPPTSITSGDICILPNGRMFATLGDNPSRLYEIENYTTAGGTVQVKFLLALPKSCYGIAYLNGKLEVTGTNIVNSCYFYTYDIATNTLGPELPFQNGQAPIDNTSISPNIGSTKRLVSANKINASTADIVYEVYVQNMGNTILNDINLVEDLAAVFGAGNVSNVSASFVSGSNIPGLTINPDFNGITVKDVLLPGQNLPNQTGANPDYYFRVLISCRVSNLQPNLTYLNSAIATATINNAVDKVVVTDSSNNGMAQVIDPNLNGNPTEAGENIPTPFDLSLLPVTFLGFEGRLPKPNLTELRWRIATPAAGADYFEVQWSTDAMRWKHIGTVKITNERQSEYRYEHAHAGEPVHFYRLRQVDRDGAFVYSSVVKLTPLQEGTTMQVYPNPAHEFLTVAASGQTQGTIILYDAKGRQVLQHSQTGRITNVNIGHLPPGIYRLQLRDNRGIQTRPLKIIH